MRKLRLAVHVALLAILVAWPVGARSAEAALMILAPNAGDSLQSGGTYTVHWEASPDMVSFRLAYSMDRGLTWITIGDDAAGPSFDWTTPAVEGEGAGCIVKVAGLNVNGDLVSESLAEVFLAAVPN